MILYQTPNDYYFLQIIGLLTETLQLYNKTLHNLLCTTTLVSYSFPSHLLFFCLMENIELLASWNICNNPLNDSFLEGWLLCAVGVAVTTFVCWKKYKKRTKPSPRQRKCDSQLYDYVDRPATNTELKLKDNVAYGHANIN